METTTVPQRDKQVDESADIHDLLRQQTELHITEGRVSVQNNQERVSHIRQLKEQLQKDSDQSGHDTMEYEKLCERRRRLRETHERVMEEELMKMERELEEQQVGGVEGEVMYLRRQTHILLLQTEALRRENQQAYADQENQYIRHQQELNAVREESLQVFRAFREVVENQKTMSERRYRTLLIDAIQDAVHLSNQNLQLQEELQELRKTLMDLQGCFSNQMPLSQ